MEYKKGMLFGVELSNLCAFKFEINDNNIGIKIDFYNLDSEYNDAFLICEYIGEGRCIELSSERILTIISDNLKEKDKNMPLNTFKIFNDMVESNNKDYNYNNLYNTYQKLMVFPLCIFGVHNFEFDQNFKVIFGKNYPGKSNLIMEIIKLENEAKINMADSLNEVENLNYYKEMLRLEIEKRKKMTYSLDEVEKLNYYIAQTENLLFDYENEKKRSLEKNKTFFNAKKIL